MTTDTSAIERELRAYLSDVMGINELDLDDDLFEVGGLTSLQSVDVLAFIEERFQVRIPPARITRAGLSSLGQLVALIEELHPTI